MQGWQIKSLYLSFRVRLRKSLQLLTKFHKVIAVKEKEVGIPSVLILACFEAVLARKSLKIPNGVADFSQIDIEIDLNIMTADSTIFCLLHI